MKAASLVFASTLLGLLLCEVGLRVAARFVPGAPANRAPGASEESRGDLRDAAAYIDRLPAASGTDRRWFTENPSPLPNRSPVNPQAYARFKEYEKRGIYGPQADYVWNRVYVMDKSCPPNSAFSNYPDHVLVFDPPSSGEHPIYRFPPSVTTASGLVTNQFGLRGPPLALKKPPRTVRIAFLGASTTINVHNSPFSYPERVVFWLNQFSQANHLDVQFEVLNAGREGIASPDTAAIVRDELLPLAPDLAVYYEGANQFEVHEMLSPAIRPRKNVDPQDPIVTHKMPALLRNHLATADLLDRALNGLNTAGEPVKPAYHLDWPRGVDERNPNVDSPSLPLNLPFIIRDLDSIRNSLQMVGAQLVLCSFEWFTPAGIPLSPVRHEFIYKQLNTALWPLRYADIRRLADFQNRVFRRYAESRKISFLDVASALPRDPNLFSDAIHMTDTGERVKAWIVFQLLVPVIRREIQSGQLPRSAGSHSLPPASLQASEMSLGCNQKPSGRIARIEDGLNIYRRQPASPDASIEAGRPLKIITPARRFAYAAVFNINMPLAPRGRVYVHIRARALKGQVGIGVLDASGSYFLVERSVPISPEMADIYFPVLMPSRAGSLVVRNADPDGARSEILIDDMELLTASESATK